MKRIFKIGLLFLIIGLTLQYRKEINSFFLINFYKINRSSELTYKNDYYRDYKYEYVQQTDDFIIKDKSQIKDVFYSIINSGVDNFTFFCSPEYKKCENDVKEISKSQNVLSNINSFVHPFNSFDSIIIKYDFLGRIKVQIKKTYTSKQIKDINEKVNDIITNQVKNETNKKQIIKIIHNYIINNSKYDSEKSDKNIDNYKSNIAYGPLLQGYGLCGGYTDSMAIFLDYYNIPNYKVLSENHIWNAVFLDGDWYHLDLTWDDPVSSDGSDILDYTFFLINNTELEKLETNQHNYDKEVFKELLTNTDKNI